MDVGTLRTVARHGTVRYRRQVYFLLHQSAYIDSVLEVDVLVDQFHVCLVESVDFDLKLLLAERKSK